MGQDVLEKQYIIGPLPDCIVEGVRLSAGNALYTLYRVANPTICHAHCQATEGCNYWVSIILFS